MRSHAAIIDAFKGPTKFGRLIGVSGIHAHGMKRRNSIPPEYWPAIVAASASATDPKQRGITIELLSTLRPPRTPRTPRKAKAAPLQNEAAA